MEAVYLCSFLYFSTFFANYGSEYNYILENKKSFLFILFMGYLHFFITICFGNLRLKERLGCEPSMEQLAASLRISRPELQSILMECSLAREKLVMSNVRLVMSIAQRYDNMGADMADLVQVIFYF